MIPEDACPCQIYPIQKTKWTPIAYFIKEFYNIFIFHFVVGRNKIFQPMDLD